MEFRYSFALLLGFLIHFENVMGNQIVARLPPDVQHYKCSNAADFTKIRSKCDYLPESEPEEERIGCEIVRTFPSGPNTLGVYSPDLALNTELDAVSASGKITNVFGDCGIITMIQDGCFVLDKDSMQASYNAQIFVDSQEYAAHMKDQFELGASIGAKASFGSVEAAYKHKIQTDTVTKSLNQVASVSRSWQHTAYSISYATCKPQLLKYMEPRFRNTLIGAFKAVFQQDQEQKDDTPKNADFEELMKVGLYLPTTYVYGVRYASDVDVHYSTYSVESQKYIADILSYGIEANITGIVEPIGDSISKAMIQAAKERGVTIETIAHTYDYNYGCNFREMLKDGADWIAIASDCAKEISKDYLPRPIGVAQNGFVSVLEILDSEYSRQYLPYEGQHGVAKYFGKYVNDYFTYCECLGGLNTFHLCKYGDGSIKETAAFVTGLCSVVSYWGRDPPLTLNPAYLGHYVSYSSDVSGGSGVILVKNSDGFSLRFLNGAFVGMHPNGAINNIILNLEVGQKKRFTFDPASGAISLCLDDDSQCIGIIISQYLKGPFGITTKEGEFSIWDTNEYKFYEDFHQ